MKFCQLTRFARVSAGLFSLVFVLGTLRLCALTADSKITAVTVYSDRAMVTRSATLEISASGPAEAEFPGLPVQIVDQSLQISGKGSSKLVILDVSSRIQHLDVTPNERIQALQNELKSLVQQTQVLDDREANLGKQDEYLGMIRISTTQAPAAGQTRPSVEDWNKLLAFQDEAVAKLAKERRSLEADRMELSTKIETVNSQLAELRGQGGRSTKTVLVRLNADAPGKVELVLHYSLPGAFWVPVYDARLNSDERVVALDYQGLVRNGTGEDWNAVAMTLSTARPALGGGTPELQPWVVDVAPTVKLIRPTPDNTSLSWSASDKKRASLAKSPLTFGAGSATELASFGVQAQNLSFVVASVESGLSAASFKIATPVTLKADNSSQKIPIALLNQAAVLEYRSVPKLQETAFLYSKLENASDFPLLSGAVNIFLDGAFVATSRLASVMPGEKYELALGADEGVSVKRRLVNRFVESVGLTSKGKRTTYEVLVTLANNKRSAEKLVISEPIPVSRNEKIELKLLIPAEREIGTPETPKEVTREQDGKLVWHLDLKPGEKRELRLKFQVEHPAEMDVIGVE